MFVCFCFCFFSSKSKTTLNCECRLWTMFLGKCVVCNFPQGLFSESFLSFTEKYTPNSCALTLKHIWRTWAKRSSDLNSPAWTLCYSWHGHHSLRLRCTSALRRRFLSQRNDSNRLRHCGPLYVLTVVTSCHINMCPIQQGGWRSPTPPSVFSPPVVRDKRQQPQWNLIIFRRKGRLVTAIVNSTF